MEELIERYNELYDDMSKSREIEKMEVFGNAAKWAFVKMTEGMPKVAEQWVDKLEAMNWHNYLSKVEANEIVSKLINQDGSKGPHWGYETFKSAVESLGGKMYCEPYYNSCALWTVANMLYSDHYASANEYVPNEDMPKYFYLMAIEKLKDADRPRFVRSYFDV